MAYITQRPEEEKQLGLGAPGGFAGGGGQGMGGAPQAGVQKGTGGTQPWVNIQNYLRANPNDQSASRTLQKEFGDPLNKSKTAAESALGEATSAINAQKASAESALGSVDENLNAAKSAYRESILNKSPNIYGSATNRAVESAKYQFQTPEFKPSYIDAGLQADAEQLKNPYGYISQKYAGQGLNAGQRALQEQLTRKSTNLPALTSALSGQYNQAKSDIEARNAAVAQDLAGTEESYRNKFADASKRANQYVNNQADLQRDIGPGQQALYSQMLGSPFLSNQYSSSMPLTDIGKLIDAKAQGHPGDSALSKQQEQYKTVVDRLLAKYGFQG